MNIGQAGIITAGICALASVCLVLLKFRRSPPARAEEPEGAHAHACAATPPGRKISHPSDGAHAHPAGATHAKPKQPDAKPEYAYPDLSPCEFYAWLDDGNSRFRSVGWLSKNRPYSRGKVDAALFQKLLALLADPWTVVCLPRRVECPFCPLINPNHGKKEQPWWAMRRGVADGLELVDLNSPEAVARVKSHRYTKGGVAPVFESASLFVPGNGFLYVGHAMIAHFIDAHGYSPPAGFWEAVRDCPPMNSQGYLERLLFNGPRNPAWAAAVWAGSVLKVPDEEPGAK